MAAPILSYEGLGLVQGEGWLLRGLDLYLGERDRLALIGRNGAGKTTLFKCLAGLIDTDEGKRTIVPGTHVVLLEQDPPMAGPATLEEWVLHGPDAPEPHEAAAIADQLGVDLARPVATASGGERRRAAIARALAQRPDVLLLDEPTNHLDLKAIEWLEDWLKRFTGAFIVISHDRTFLTRLTNSCLWLDRGALRRAEIGFGGFEAWTERIYEEEARAAEKLDAKLKLELHWLQRGVTARRRRNQGRLAKLHELRAQRAAMLGSAGTAKLALAKDDVRSKTVIDADGVSKSNWPERLVCRPHRCDRTDHRPARVEIAAHDQVVRSAVGRRAIDAQRAFEGHEASRRPEGDLVATFSKVEPAWCTCLQPGRRWLITCFFVVDADLPRQRHQWLHGRPG